VKIRSANNTGARRGSKPTVFEVDDLILLSTRDVKPVLIRQAGGNKTLLPKFLGPFQITRKVGFTTYELHLPLKLKVNPVISIVNLKGYNQNLERFGPRDAPRSIRPDSVVIQPSIEGIRGHRLSRGKSQLLVRYANTADQDDT
jgi:hypothetical protein